MRGPNAPLRCLFIGACFRWCLLAWDNCVWSNHSHKHSMTRLNMASIISDDGKDYKRGVSAADTARKLMQTIRGDYSMLRPENMIVWDETPAKTDKPICFPLPNSTYLCPLLLGPATLPHCCYIQPQFLMPTHVHFFQRKVVLQPSPNNRWVVS